MSEIKYFQELTLGEIAERTDKAVKQCSYVELMNALNNIGEKPFDQEALVKSFRRVAAKPAHERTDFESIVVMIVSIDLEAEIVNQGK